MERFGIARRTFLLQRESTERLLTDCRLFRLYRFLHFELFVCPSNIGCSVTVVFLSLTHECGRWNLLLLCSYGSVPFHCVLVSGCLVMHGVVSA